MVDARSLSVCQSRGRKACWPLTREVRRLEPSWTSGMRSAGRQKRGRKHGPWKGVSHRGRGSLDPGEEADRQRGRKARENDPREAMSRQTQRALDERGWQQPVGIRNELSWGVPKSPGVLTSSNWTC